MLGRAKPCNDMGAAGSEINNEMDVGSGQRDCGGLTCIIAITTPTSPLRPECLSAMTHALAIGGNPSSIHGAGRAARVVVEDAREKVAALAGAKPDMVIFTSGATEANNTGVVRRGRSFAR